MRTPKEQLAGLDKLAQYLTKKWEVNVGIIPAGADVAYLFAAAVPTPSQITYAANGYDVWVQGPERYDLQSTDLTLEQAAEAVKTEYFLAKAARTKMQHPHLALDEIMKTLEAGYQR
jgi:hypothetical protein